jgi:predicted ATPase
MLKALRIRNLKNFDDSNNKIEFNKENVFIGPNNAGKSTIFNAINLFREIIASSQGIPYRTEYYDLNSFEDAVYLHDKNRNIEIELEFKETKKNHGLHYEYHTHRYEFEIHSDNQFRYKLYENDKPKEETDTGQVRRFDNKHVERANKIWYVQPVRSLIPYHTQLDLSQNTSQPLNPSGRNVTQFLMQRAAARDPILEKTEQWLQKIDPNLTLIKTPLQRDRIAFETNRRYDEKDSGDINICLQGTGIHNAAIIISAVLFSPSDSTICIEEPESFLHARSQEVLIDLFNYAVNKLDKQIILSTHSWDILKVFMRDIYNEPVRQGKRNDTEHEIANEDNVKLFAFNLDVGPNKITSYDMKKNKYEQIRRYFADLLG